MTQKGGHLPEDALLGVMEGLGAPEARAHVSSCLHCQARVEQAAAGLGLAREAEIPEPSPLYWESFRRQVGRRIQDGDTTPRWRQVLVSPWMALAAATVVAVALVVPRGPAPRPAGTAGPVLPAWSALPPADEDDGLDLLAAVIPAATELPLAECQGLGDCMSEAAALTDEESRALAAALRRELEASS